MRAALVFSWSGGKDSAMALHALLRRAVGPRDTPMLPQVIEPRVGEEGLDHPLGMGGVLEHVPVVGAIAPAFVAERHERGEERFAVFCGNVVLDRDQHGTRILIQIRGQDRLGPVHRWREIRRRPRLQRPPARHPQRDEGTARGEEVRRGEPEILGGKTPQRAADRQGAEEHRHVHRKTPATHPVRQHCLCRDIEDGEHPDPRDAREQARDHRDPGLMREPEEHE